MKKHILFLTLILGAAGCEDFVKLDGPSSALHESQVFSSDESATAAMNYVYYDMVASNVISQGNKGISAVSGLTADEIATVSIQIPYQELYKNSILPDNAIILDIWAHAYQNIYRVNAIIANLEESSGVSSIVRDRLIGEAKFMRAFIHFYLFNLFGDIPLITTVDYEMNRLAPRASAAEVYHQLVDDLEDAKFLLPVSYVAGDNAATANRVRPNKWAASALLARVYLYMENWSAAESEASEVIAESALYTLEANPANVFKSTSKEALWQLQPLSGINYTGDGFFYSAVALKAFGFPPFNFSYDLSCMMNNELVSTFEANDARVTNWTVNYTFLGTTYWIPAKYKNAAAATAQTEFTMVLRLAEQYLIRAEARAMQGKFTGSGSAAEDLDVIRTRAALPATTAATVDEMMLAIEQERRVELFTEWGHRWLDMKRWKGFSDPSITRAEEVMPDVTTAKGGEWSDNWLLYPIPKIDVQRNPNIAQNPGYTQ